MSIIRELLEYAVQHRASDIHIKSGQPPFLRISGDLNPTDHASLEIEDVNAIAEDILPEHLREVFAATHEVDFSLHEPNIGRFRVNMFFGKGEPVVAMRHVNAEIPTIESLFLPPALHQLSQLQRGIVLVSGATGSGKSTTLAAVIGEMNRTVRNRIITIEDPIEYTFIDDQCLITQREVGLDTLTFAEALRHVLRQDPDVILIGEMRDPETIRTALLASETGHLVFSTLHASTASLAVPRILDVFPTDEQDQIRQALAGNLATILCQRLVPSTTGSVVPAVEILFNTPTVRKLLMRNQLDVLSAAIETGREDGMQSFNQALYEFIKSGAVSEKEGLLYATNPDQLRMNLKGIFLDDARKILAGL